MSNYEFSEHAQSLLKNFYLLENETDPKQAFNRAATAFSAGDEALATRICDYVNQGWFMFSSPILSNARNDDTKGGLPISCFLSYVPDTVEGLIDHSNELRWMSVMGGGVGGHWSDIRSVSNKAPGPIPFIKTVDSDMQAWRQGVTRKGSYAAYIDVSHPDIIEFINLRVPTGGDTNRKCFNINNAVCISDEFMNAVADGKDWNLIDPHSKQIKETMPARELWQRILEIRFRTGEPYFFFTDTANKALPESLKAKGLKIHGSNLCNEIMLATSEDRSAVCCLSSLNLEYFDDWKDTTIVEDCITFLDNVLQAFIDKAPKTLSKAIFSAISERSLGLGTMGFHAYLQSKNIPWESPIAKGINKRLFKHIKERSIAQTERLAKERGEYLDGIGTGRRNSHLLAIAPNANSAIILDTSPSIEPWKSNAFTHRTRAGSFLQKNKYLDKLLLKATTTKTEYDEVWQSIILNQGSVQHLDILNDYQKGVFKTAFEIEQAWLIEHAADRQEYICQGQSLNLFFPAGSDKAYVNYVHILAWKKGLKGLYYLRTNSGAEAERISQKIERKALKDYDECIACQG
ncbi:NrdA Ribonucleotide reductase, alpha subunit [uncultured Caudovirales phage]|uniref:Ribonucleoside-diphosphate reductase n=1 Tax=uncultured Caudovirales phage TaxID=2100421 RepID=A0A6J5NJY1_9CAUD|nr:NrdA Ribonucleotide reductase, alpha subunit [uncultured Caudovirales phage]